MSERVGIPKKVRFEVFKRDSFTCQYCGGKSPDVVLVVDHVHPVARGGDNDIMNLITSCQPCNAGKGARELSDQTTLEKQRKQLEELNERREQLEMMIGWRNGLSNLTDSSIDAFCDKLNEDTCGGHYINDKGRLKVRKWLKKYSLQQILDAWDTAFTQYVEFDKQGAAVPGSVEKAFDYVPRILSVEKRMEDKPYLKDLFYIRGILRNRLHYCNEFEALKLLERAHLAGGTIESLREHAKTAPNWTVWREYMMHFLEENEE
jgi:hypothetical protein